MDEVTRTAHAIGEVMNGKPLHDCWCALQMVVGMFLMRSCDNREDALQRLDQFYASVRAAVADQENWSNPQFTGRFN